jgi:hypothetical protein
MIFTKTSLNTTIPGMHGYKNEEKSDKIKEAKDNYKNYGWLIKG